MLCTFGGYLTFLTANITVRCTFVLQMLLLSIGSTHSGHSRETSATDYGVSVSERSVEHEAERSAVSEAERSEYREVLIPRLRLAFRGLQTFNSSGVIYQLFSFSLSATR